MRVFACTSFEVFSGGDFDVAGAKLRNLHLNELILCRKENILESKSLLNWKNALADGSDEANITSGKDALIETIKDRTCIKHSVK